MATGNFRTKRKVSVRLAKSVVYSLLVILGSGLVANPQSAAEPSGKSISRPVETSGLPEANLGEHPAGHTVAEVATSGPAGSSAQINLKLLASAKETLTELLEQVAETPIQLLYDSGRKHLISYSLGVPGLNKLNAGAIIVVLDLDDWLGISPEGQDGWVTYWIDLQIGYAAERNWMTLLDPTFPIGTTLTSIERNPAEGIDDPRRQGSFTPLGVNAGVVSIDLLQVDFDSQLVGVTPSFGNLGVSFLTTTWNVRKGEIQLSTLDAIAADALSAGGQTGAQFAASILGALVDIRTDGLAPLRVPTAARSFTSSDDPQLDGGFPNARSILNVDGGPDVDGNGRGDHYIPPSGSGSDPTTFYPLRVNSFGDSFTQLDYFVRVENVPTGWLVYPQDVDGNFVPGDTFPAVNIEPNTNIGTHWGIACSPSAPGDAAIRFRFYDDRLGPNNVLLDTVDVGFSCSDPPPPPPPPTTVTLSSSTTSITLGGSVNSATLTAQVRQHDGQPAGGNIEVTFVPSHPALTGCTPDAAGCITQTNSSSVATVNFAPQTAGTFDFSAVASTGGTDSVEITAGKGGMSGGASPNPVSVGFASRLDVLATDAAGAPLSAGVPVTFQTTFPGTFQGNGASSPFSPSTVLTDGEGNAWVNFTGSTAGTANITITAPGASPGVIVLQVDPLSSDIRVSLAIQPQEIGQNSSTYRIEGRVTDASGVPIGNERVDFSSSSGTLSADWDITGSTTGTASSNLTVTTSGNVAVTASARGVPATRVFLAQVGPTQSAEMLPVRTFTLGTGDVWGLEFSPDNSTFIAGDDNRHLIAWNANDWSQKWSVTADDDDGAQVSISPDSSKVLFGNSDGTEIFRVSDGAQLCGGTIVNSVGRGIKVTFATNSSFFDTGREELILHSTLCHSGNLEDNIAPDQFWEYGRLARHADVHGINMIATVSRRGFVRRWNGLNGNRIGSPISVAGDDGGDLDFSADGAKLVAVAFETVKVFDTATWNDESFIASSLADEYYGATFLDNDTKLAIGAAGKLEILDYPAGTSFAVADIPGRALEIDWNEQTGELAVGTSAGQVLIFRPLVPPDTSAPEIAFSSPAADNFVTNVSPLTTTGIVTDASSIAAFEINGTPVSLDVEGRFSHPVSLIPGSNTISYEVTDAANNTATYQLTGTFVLDTTPPVISGVGVTPGAGPPGTPFSVQATVVDGDSGVATVSAQLRDGSGGLVGSPRSMLPIGGDSYTASFDSTALAVGFYSFDITAVDSSSQANSDTVVGAATVSVGSVCHALTLSHTGSGSVVATPTSSGGCLPGAYEAGTVVQLTAAPAGGSLFAGWTGDPDCSDGLLTMTGGRACTAAFDSVESFVLSVSTSGTGTGTVASTPAGITCGADCSESYPQNTVVTLTATPGADSGLTGWSGSADCADGVVTMNGARSCVATFSSNSLGGYYTLDRFGGVHVGGDAPVLTPPTPYWGFDVAQDLELAAAGYYVLDRFGGVHAGGGAPILSPRTPYWGFDVGQDLELAETGYYVLDRFGGVHAGAGAPVLSPPTPYWGWNVAQDLELVTSGYYVLDRYGGIHAGGGAPVLSPRTPYWGFDVAQDLELAFTGFYVLDRFGGVHAGGGAPILTPLTPYWGFDVAQDLELAPAGYYVLDRFGGVHAGGGAPLLSPPTPYWGWNVAQDLELGASGQ